MSLVFTVVYALSALCKVRLFDCPSKTVNDDLSVSDLAELHHVDVGEVVGWRGHVPPLLDLRVLVRPPAPTPLQLPLPLAGQHLLPGHLWKGPFNSPVI